MRRHPRLVVVGLLLALLGLVAGCGGNPKPETLPSPTPSPSSSATATAGPSPPVLPAAAKARSLAGARAFARHYISLINYAQATGRVDSLSAVEAAGCKSCASSERYLSDLYAGGGTITGGDFKITGITTVPNPATEGWLVEIGVEFGPQLVDHPAPKTDEHPKGGRLPLNVQVAWQDDGWRVLEWTRGA